MRKFTTTLLALTLFSCANAPKKAEAECVCAPDALNDGKISRLVVGTDKFVDIAFEPSQHGVFIGNPNLLAVTVIKSGTRIQLLLKPLNSGATSLSVLDSLGATKYQQQFVLNSTDLTLLSNQLIDLLKDAKGASVKIQKDRVVIDGELLNTADLGRIAKIASDRTYADYVLNLTRLSPQFFTDLAVQANEEIKKQFPNAGVRAMNSQLWIEGKVENPEQSNRAAKIVSLLLPEVLPGDLLEESPEALKLPTRARVQNFLKW